MFLLHCLFMGTRIAKFLAAAGVCSRRQAEELVRSSRVSVDGEILSEVGYKVGVNEVVAVDGVTITYNRSVPRLWLFHKPAMCIVSERDELGRVTIFDKIGDLGIVGLPRLVSVGRLDYNSEGLLLLTDSGALARILELPQTAIERHYRVRVFGKPNPEDLEKIRGGLEIDGVQYRPCEVELEDNQNLRSSNLWLYMILQEGKNREIRYLFEFFGLRVNRLVRLSYGAFHLGSLQVGDLSEVSAADLRESLKSIEAATDLFR